MSDPIELIKNLMEPYLPPVESRPQETDGDLANLEHPDITALLDEAIKEFLANRASTNNNSNTL